MLASISKISREGLYGVLLFSVIFLNSIGYKLGSIAIILLTLFYLIDRNLIGKIKRGQNRLMFLFFVYFFLHIVGFLYTSNRSLAEHEITVRLPFLLLPLIIFTEKIRFQYIYNIFSVFKYWLMFLAVILIYHKLFIVKGPLLSLPELSLRALTNIHHAYMSLFYIFALFFIMYEIANQRISNFFGFLQIGFILFFITILGARVTIAIAIIVTIIFFIYRIRKTSGLLQLLIPIVLIGASFFIVKKTNLIDKFSRLSKVEWNIDKNIYNHQVFSFEYDENTSNTLELRLIKWYSALQIIKEHPVTGVGTGDYKDHLNEQYRKIDFKKGIAYGYNTHNQYIEECIKFGLIGGVFFIFFIGYIVWKAYSKKNYLLFLTTLSVAALLFIESAFARQHGVVFFCFFIPILYVFHDSLPKQKKAL